jgi:hypothetical protein
MQHGIDFRAYDIFTMQYRGTVIEIFATISSFLINEQAFEHPFITHSTGISHSSYNFKLVGGKTILKLDYLAGCNQNTNS